MLEPIPPGIGSAILGATMRARSLLACLALTSSSILGCGDDTAPPPDDSTRFVMDLTADLHDPASFYEVPYPNDLRLKADGTADLAGFPNPSAVVNVAGLVANASEQGFPVIPVAFLRFNKDLAPRVPADVIPASPDAPILLIDVDPASPERGRLFPTIAQTLEPDVYTAEHVLAVAARPGFVLRPGTAYAVVVMRSVNDKDGLPIATQALLERLKLHKPEGEAETAADAVYAKLWDALPLAEASVDDVVAATVFTTGKAAETTAALGDAVLAKYDVTIEDLAIDPVETYTSLCTLRGKVTLPQFQHGTPPYDEDGRFVMGSDGLPKVQRMEDAPIAIVIPRSAMPANGYPLILNVHGSGGFSIAMVRPVGDDGLPGDPIGPAFPNALKGLATAGMAMPLNPERLVGASETAYLNENNMGAMRDTFRQGVLEARLYLEALQKLEIDPAVLTDCTGATLPAGETSFHFDASKMAIMGQSMGGMYTNMIGATEPKLTAAVPTGAGGLWTYFIFETGIRDGQVPAFLQLLLGTPVKLGYMHPVLAIGAAALEAADPIVYMPHLARRPLEGHPVRPIYEPVGKGDSYFPTDVYDAVALAYGHEQAGNAVWPEMQEALALDGKDGLLDFPVTNNVRSESGAPYTGVVAQFEGDGSYDPHAIYSHRDDVKRQYSCFLDSFFKTGKAVVPPLADNWTDPCP